MDEFCFLEQKHLFFLPWVRAFLSNMTLPATVVTGFVPCGLRAITADVSYLTAIEATSARESLPTNCPTKFYTLSSIIGTITSKMTSCTTVVA